MLERIHHIRGTGLLHDADGRPYAFQKATLIYADNGRGKSTLASVFRSCSTNNPHLILNRRTIDGVNNQEIRLQFSNGQFVDFQNGAWSQQIPEMHVFDADFVEQNVYSGGQVSPDQRRNLLQFALGDRAVAAQRDYDLGDEAARQAITRVREIIGQLSAAHAGLTLEQFQRIPKVEDPDDKISALNSRIVEAENIGQILAKAIPSEIAVPELDIDPFFSVLNKALANIDLAAEEKVKEHLDKHNKPGLQRWVGEGNNYGDEENCPFCDQALEGVELIAAYRSFFNDDFNRLKTDVAGLNQFILTNCTDAIIDRLKSSFDTTVAILDGWKEHLQFEDIAFDQETANRLLVELRSTLESLKEQKEANILEPVGSEEEKRSVQEKWQQIVNAVTESNRQIKEAVSLINAYKAKLAAVDVAELRQEIENINWSKRRHEAAIEALFSELQNARATEATAQTEKQTKKDILNQTMEATLDAYKDSINQLLRNFGAQFEIPNIDYHYRGGLRSDYVLRMRGGDIALNDGVPDFRTALSEGDKRTLAFAFFIASIEADPNLANKIVVIDDPMCSLDLNRKQQTRTVLKRIHDNCQQLIVLAHDAHFLRSLRDDILRSPNINPNDIKTIKLRAVANNYSDFDGFNIDQECETAYFKAHRILDDYLNGVSPSSMEVAKSIRPMLEGYLHRRFPGRISSGQMFGQVIIEINNAQPPSPLVHAQNITAELTEINTYAGQFHHDTNPAVGQVVLVDGELRSFVVRALEVVHRGVV